MRLVTSGCCHGSLSVLFRVSGVADDPSDRKIVIAVIRLAQAMGLVTIAEGVEDSAQLAILRDFGCDQAQGYLFGRPQAGPPRVPSLSLASTGEAS